MIKLILKNSQNSQDFFQESSLLERILLFNEKDIPEFFNKNWAEIKNIHKNSLKTKSVNVRRPGIVVVHMLIDSRGESQPVCTYAM